MTDICLKHPLNRFETAACDKIVNVTSDSVSQATDFYVLYMYGEIFVVFGIADISEDETARNITNVN